MEIETACKVLGIEFPPTLEECKKGFRRKAKETHPDQNPGVDPFEFLLVSAAFDVCISFVKEPKDSDLNLQNEKYDTDLDFERFLVTLRNRYQLFREKTFSDSYRCEKERLSKAVDNSFSFERSEESLKQRIRKDFRNIILASQARLCTAVEDEFKGWSTEYNAWLTSRLKRTSTFSKLPVVSLENANVSYIAFELRYDGSTSKEDAGAFGAIVGGALGAGISVAASAVVPSAGAFIARWAKNGAEIGSAIGSGLGFSEEERISNAILSAKRDAQTFFDDFHEKLLKTATGLLQEFEARARLNYKENLQNQIYFLAGRITRDSEESARVKHIKCSYCGQRIPETISACNHCGCPTN